MDTISSGYPIVCLIAGMGLGHAVNGVGVYKDYNGVTWVKLFMGWSGQSDGWVSFDDRFGISYFTDLMGIVYPCGNYRKCLPVNFYANSNQAVFGYNNASESVVPADEKGMIRAMLEVPEPMSIKDGDYYTIKNGEDEKTQEVIVKDGYWEMKYPDIARWCDQSIVPDTGFKYSTPMDIMVACDDAWLTMRNLLVICGNSKKETYAEMFLKKPAINSIITNKCVTYYVDLAIEKREQYKNLPGACGVFRVEPIPRIYEKQITFDTNKFWNVSNGRKSYGAYANEYDIMNVLIEGNGD